MQKMYTIQMEGNLNLKSHAQRILIDEMSNF